MTNSMTNLHRELAPISAAAWADLEEEARRTFRRHVAGRRIVDVTGPAGVQLSGVGTGHLQAIDPPADGVIAHARRGQPIVELRVPFAVDRQQVKDAARQLAFAEDRAIFDGYAEGSIAGVRASSSNPAITLPAPVRDYPHAVGQAVTALRLAGVDGPYSLALDADAYTAVLEISDQGYPVHEHIARIVDGEIIWAPAIDGAFLLSTRGGDFELHIGQDVSIGYLAHDTTNIQLYIQETLTFLVYAGEAAIALPTPPSPPVEAGAV
jgi:uncharacterized linocin/CFP29 family protein